MDGLQELNLSDPEQVSGGLLRGWAVGKLLDIAFDAIVDYNNSGAAADFATGAGSGAGTFG